MCCSYGVKLLAWNPKGLDRVIEASRSTYRKTKAKWIEGSMKRVCENSLSWLMLSNVDVTNRPMAIQDDALNVSENGVERDSAQTWPLSLSQWGATYESPTLRQFYVVWCIWPIEHANSRSDFSIFLDQRVSTRFIMDWMGEMIIHNGYRSKHLQDVVFHSVAWLLAHGYRWQTRALRCNFNKRYTSVVDARDSNIVEISRTNTIYQGSSRRLTSRRYIKIAKIW